MQSQTQASSGLNPVATELQLETRTEAQPGQNEPDAQLGEEMDPKLPVPPHITPKPLLQCLECHIIFSDPERQQRHLKRSHPSEYEQYILRNAFFACYICGLQFTNSGELKAHQKTHTEKKAYKCMICGQAFNRSFQLTLHKKIHIGQEGYKCTDCGKACKTMTLLKYHRRTHTGERPFVCKECGRRFAMSKYLKKHMLFHSKRRAEGDGKRISVDGGFKGTSALLNFVKANQALLPSEPGAAPPAGHQMKQNTPVVTESASQPALPQLGPCGHLENVDTNMGTELIRGHSETLGNVQKVNHFVILGQVPVGEHEVASGDGGPKTVSCSVCNTIFKSTNTLLSHIKTRHASLLSAASEASAAGHLANLPVIQNALLRLMANEPIYKYDANMDEEQIFRLSEFLRSIQRVNNVQQVSQGTIVTDKTTEKTVSCSIYQEGAVTTDVKEVIIENAIKVEEEYNGDKPLSVVLHKVLGSTPNSPADQELCLKTVINKSQGLNTVQLISDPPLAGPTCQDGPSASMQTHLHCDVQVKEECSVGLNEAQATQDSSICWNVNPANVFDTSSPSKQGSLECTDCGLLFTNQEFFETHLHQHALEEEEADEEEAEKGENLSRAAQLDFTEMYADESRDQDIGGDENVSTTSSSMQSNPSGTTQDGAVRQNHFCLVCGKVYKYPSALMRHQQQHNKPDPVVRSVLKGAKYECPDCGTAFIRKARLIAHMRTHRSSGPVNLETLNCDQCHKSFTSDKLWKNHIELHKRKPFWCLRCSVGFSSEKSLEKHLLGHDLRKYTCDICYKSFRLHSQLVHHQNTHTGAKPFQCSVCGQSFANPRNLILHKKIHVRVSSGMTLGLGIANELGIKTQKQTYTSVSEVRDTNVSELTDEGYWMEESRTLKVYEDAEIEGSEYTVEADSWEPVHPRNTPKPPGFTASDVYHESTLEAMKSQTGQQLDKKETRDTIMYEDHKHWEWECCVCEMGFDEVAELHMHYIKHATGELPVEHDELRG